MKNWVPAEQPADNALWRYAGLPANRGMQLIELLSMGLPVSILDNIHEWTEMSKTDILRITGINERNVARRLDTAVDYFGSKQDAYDWLQSPVRGLGNVAPIDLIATESGALEVTDLIGRLEHCVFA